MLVTVSALLAVRTGEWGLAPELTEDAAARIAGGVSSSRAEGTRRTYASAWRFSTWFIAHRHTVLPAHPVTVAAIGYRHRATGHPTCTLTSWCAREPPSMLSGIRRTYATAGDRPRTPRAPLLVDDIVTIVTAARQAVTGWAPRSTAGATPLCC